MTLALSIRDLHKSYKSGTKALNGIDLDVQQGDFFALLGPNGAGKSTTIGIISALVNKTSGSVKVFDFDTDTQLEDAKSQLGLVPQEFNFNQFETVLQIVVNQAGYYGVPKSVALVRAEKYLGQLGLWEKRHARSRELSGGMKRRLMIARALMHEPKLLILDEPTAGVDIELRRSMWEFLKEINAQGVTIILTTHYLEEAEMLCRNIAIIDKGRIIENTSMKALLGKLNKETFVLDLKTGRAELTLPGFVTRKLDEHSFEVDVEKNQGLNAVFAALAAMDITVLSMRNKANRLEELFVSLIGEETLMFKPRYLIALQSILNKETNRFLRIWVQTLVPPAITMTLYFVIFGNLIGSQIGQIHGFSYMEFIVPGLIMMSVITNSYANVASSFFSAKFQRNVEELLVAPVPNYIIVLGFVGGGVARGVLVGLIVTVLSLFFVDIRIHHLWVIVSTVLLTSAVFSLGGLINAVYAKTFDDISIVPTFVLTPLTYLGGVFYSLSLLPEFWQGVSTLNPIVYMVNAFRYGFLGHSDVSLTLAYSVLIGLIVVLFGIAMRLIRRGTGLRS